MYMVTAIRELSETYSVEVAGIFDTEDKAYEAKNKVESWMVNNGYEDYEVFVSPATVNRLAWYEIEEDISSPETDFDADDIKISITKLIKEIGLGDLICTSFEEAKNNSRKKNLVVIDDADVYLTYKYRGTFGEFLCWVEDEFKEDATVYDSVLEWIKDIYYRPPDEIDRCIASDELITGFKPY